MATTLQIAGPTTVSVTIGAGSITTLGYSDNDNLPSFSFTDNQHEVRTVLSGMVPEEIVLVGTSARISLALVKWDETVLNSVLANQRGATYNANPVGRRLISNTAYFVLTIAGTDGSTVEFPVTYLQSDGVGDSQWGNRERVLTLNLMAIANSEGVLYTYTPATPPA